MAMNKLNEEWAHRINKAKEWISKYQREWKNNVKLYNGQKKFNKNIKCEYYTNIIWQTYESQKASIIPLSIECYAEVEKEFPDPSLNLKISALLNNILDNKKNIKILDKLFTQAKCKGLGIAMILIKNKEKKELSINDIYLKFIKTENFIYDKDLITEFIEDAPWLGASYDLSLKEFLMSDSYINKEEILKANGINKQDIINLQEALLNRREDKNLEYWRYYPIKIWEIWDTIDRKRYYVEDKSGYFAKEISDYPIDNPSFNHPFLLLSFTEGSTDEYPPPAEIDLLKDLQDNYNIIKSSQIRDMKRMIRKIFALKDAINTNEEQKLLNFDHDQIIKVDGDMVFGVGQQRDLRAILWAAPENPPPPQTDYILAGIKNDFRETTGYGSAERGGISPASTATEAGKIYAMLMGRNTKKVADVLNLWKEAAEKILYIVEELFPEEIKINIAKYGQPSIWQNLELKEIKNKEININVYVGSKGIVDKSAKLAEYLQSMNILFPLAQNYNMDLSFMIRKIMLLLNWTPDEVEYIFKGQREMAKQIAIEMARMMEQGGDMAEAMKLFGLISNFLQNYLTPNEIAEIQGKFKASGGKAPISEKPVGLSSVRTSRLQEDQGKGII